MSFFDARTIALLSFVILNLIIIFAVRSRASLVMSLIISCLILILFFSISVTNYATFKEVAIALIAYFLVATIIIFNRNFDAKNDNYAAQNYKKRYRSQAIILVVAAIVFGITFSVIEAMPKISELIANGGNKKEISSTKTNEAKVVNPDFTNAGSKKNQKFDTKLLDHALLKHYSDGILIIVTISTCLLISLQKNHNSNSDS